MSYALDRAVRTGALLAQTISGPFQQALMHKAEREFRKQQEEENFNRQIQLLAARDPNFASALTAVQPGSTVDGQKSLKALPLAADQQADIAAGKMAKERPTISLGGFALDPATLKQSELVDEERKMRNQIIISKAIAEGRPTNQFIIDPSTGAVSIGNKRTGEVAPATQAGSTDQFKTTPKPTQAQIVNPETGVRHTWLTDGQGNLVKDLGPSESLKGTVVQDPATGEISVVNAQLPSGTGAGQAAPVTRGGTAPQADSKEAKPFKIGTTSGKIGDADIAKISAWDAMIEDFERVEKLLKGKDDSVGPVAGRVYKMKRKLPGFQVDEATSDLFSSIGSISAEQIHERYGGALTANEIGRSANWSISENDKAIDLRSKLNQALEEVRAKRKAYLKNLGIKGVDVSRFGIGGAENGIGSESPVSPKDEEKPAPPTKDGQKVGRFIIKPVLKSSTSHAGL